MSSCSVTNRAPVLLRMSLGKGFNFPLDGALVCELSTKPVVIHLSVVVALAMLKFHNRRFHKSKPDCWTSGGGVRGSV